MFSLPRRVPGGMAFSLVLLGPFLIASVSSMLKTVGDLTLCEKINDANWKRTDMKSVSGGILAGSIGTTLAALLGAVGQSTFSSNVGLSMATGATSRAIALPTGLFLIALAFFPKLAAIFSGMPPPVMGAVLIYVACFMIVGGFQVLTSRMLDARKTFVVGISLIFGLSVEIAPQLYRDVPAAVQPLFDSALSLTTVLAVLLNLLFRIGVAKRRKFELVPGPDNRDTISRILEEQGAAWGMRKEVELRAVDALTEFMNSAQKRLHLTSPTVAVQVEFDEFKLEVDIDYDGLPVQLPEELPPFESLADEDGVALLSGYMIRRYADHVKVTSQAGHCRVHLHFEH
jgi:NCS2 family nucleobase:cation symporter-2